MRKSAVRESRNITTAHVQGYHETTTWTSDGSYTAEGFEGYEAGTMPYIASDRTHKITFAGEKVNPKTGELEKFNPMAYGLEIETGCDGILSDSAYATVLKNILFPIFPKGLFKMQHDGSLRGRSTAELITGLMTKEAIRNNYPNFKKMFNEFFPLFIIGADSAHGCGMHVNISRGLFGKTDYTQEDTAKKLCYFINKHYAFCKELFARDGSTTFCGQIEAFTTWERVDRHFDRYTDTNDHGLCLNLSHWNEGSGRLEIRLVGGQCKYGTFRNTMETIFVLVPRLIKLNREALDDMAKVFSGCNKYVFDRLSTRCYQAGTISREDIDRIRPTVTEEEYF